MATAQINGASLNYSFLGTAGPVVILMSAGRWPVVTLRPMARVFVAHGFRALLYDRRNCGRSSLDFQAASEETAWADDLLSLMETVKIRRGFFLGRSSTSRIALRIARDHPDRVLGLGLVGISGGLLARRALVDHYFGQYERACRVAGMSAVCELASFKSMIEVAPDARVRIEATDPVVFLAAMARWRTEFLTAPNGPVLGFSDQDLQSLSVPIGIANKHNRTHPESTLHHALKSIPHSQLIDRPEGYTHGSELPLDLEEVAVDLVGYFRQFQNPAIA